jgi:hypothetical protein
VERRSFPVPVAALLLSTHMTTLLLLAHTAMDLLPSARDLLLWTPRLPLGTGANDYRMQLLLRDDC